MAHITLSSKNGSKVLHIERIDCCLSRRSHIGQKWTFKSEINSLVSATQQSPLQNVRSREWSQKNERRSGPHSSVKQVRLNELASDKDSTA